MATPKYDEEKAGSPEIRHRRGYIYYFIPAEIIIIIIPAEIIIVKNMIIKFRRTKPERHYNYKNYANKKQVRNYSYIKNRTKLQNEKSERKVRTKNQNERSERTIRTNSQNEKSERKVRT